MKWNFKNNLMFNTETKQQMRLDKMSKVANLKICLLKYYVCNYVNFGVNSLI